MDAAPHAMTQPTLARRLTLTGLVATGVCSMIGVAINTIPFTMQRTIPGLGPNVLLAFILAAIPALLCGLAFAALAILITDIGVAAFYLLFTAAVYHAVPWSYVADKAMTSDVTAPGLLGYLLPRTWGAIVAAGASVALIKDLPAMLMGISRLPFAWAEDGIFPARLAAVHPTRRTPHIAILVTAGMASLSVGICAMAGDFLRAVDVTVTAILVNFVLMSVAVLALPRRNAAIAARITVLRGATTRDVVAAAGALSLGALLAVQCWRDLHADHPWYLSSTWGWVIVVAVGTTLYARETRRLRAAGVDLEARFRETPAQ